MNVSGKYIWVFFFAAQLVPMFNPIAASEFMGFNMESFVWLNTACCAIGLLSIPFIKITFRRLKESGKLVEQEPIEKPEKEDQQTDSIEEWEFSAL